MQFLLNIEQILIYTNYEYRELQISSLKSQSNILPQRLITLLNESGYAKTKL